MPPAGGISPIGKLEALKLQRGLFHLPLAAKLETSESIGNCFLVENEWLTPVCDPPEPCVSSLRSTFGFSSSSGKASDIHYLLTYGVHFVELRCCLTSCLLHVSPPGDSSVEMSSYASLFKENNITGKRLLLLDEEDLKDMGIVSRGHIIHFKVPGGRASVSQPSMCWTVGPALASRDEPITVEDIRG